MIILIVRLSLVKGQLGESVKEEERREEVQVVRCQVQAFESWWRQIGQTSSPAGGYLKRDRFSTNILYVI